MPSTKYIKQNNTFRTIIITVYECTMYTVQCTLYNVHCTMYNVQCTMYNVQCTMYNVQCTMYNVQCTPYNVHPIMNTSGYREMHAVAITCTDNDIDVDKIPGTLPINVFTSRHLATAASTSVELVTVATNQSISYTAN